MTLIWRTGPVWICTQPGLPTKHMIGSSSSTAWFSMACRGAAVQLPGKRFIDGRNGRMPGDVETAQDARKLMDIGHRRPFFAQPLHIPAAERIA